MILWENKSIHFRIRRVLCKKCQTKGNNPFFFFYLEMSLLKSFWGTSNKAKGFRFFSTYLSVALTVHWREEYQWIITYIFCYLLYDLEYSAWFIWTTFMKLFIEAWKHKSTLTIKKGTRTLLIFSNFVFHGKKNGIRVANW